MHPWSKVIITQYVYKKTRKYISNNPTLTPIHAYTGGHEYRLHPKKSYNHQTGAPKIITTAAHFFLIWFTLIPV